MSKSRRVVFVVGPDRVGKSTFGNRLAYRLHCPCVETGVVCVEALARLFVSEGRYHDQISAVHAILGAKEYCRPQLVSIGYTITRVYPDALVREALAAVPDTSDAVVVGVRRVRELEAAVRSLRAEGRLVCVVRVERCGPAHDYELADWLDIAAMYRCSSVSEVEACADTFAESLAEDAN